MRVGIVRRMGTCAVRSFNRFSVCPGIPPNKYHYIDDLVVIVPQNVWEYLYNR